jgi:phage baseplate assembly protein W
MAQIINNKFPIDSFPAKAVGVNLPLNGPAVFVSNYLTRDAIKNNLINWFSTEKGERVFSPFFGSAIRSLLFDNIELVTDDLIKTIINDEINQYFNYVTLVQVLINQQPEYNTITITITYQVSNFGINDTINITL